jgi:hypothetical protein
MGGTHAACQAPLLRLIPLARGRRPFELADPTRSARLLKNEERLAIVERVTGATPRAIDTFAAARSARQAATIMKRVGTYPHRDASP